MILFVSGRTDIVAFYSKWFIKRWEAGFVDVRNPFNPKLVSRINFSNVDMLFFCTKNPLPIIPYLSMFDKPILFHVTLTPYKKEIEPNVTDKSKVIDGIKEISKIIGSDNVVVRYDPIFINDVYTMEYHKRAFKRMCELLNGYVNRIIVSFLDDYKNVQKNMGYLKPKSFTEEMYREIGESFSKYAWDNGMTVQTCFENRNLVEYGFVKGDCLSKELALKMTGKKYPKQTMRKGNKCECVQMVDIGVYNTCNHMCKYCYANYMEDLVNSNHLKHDDNSSLLIGKLESDDIIKERLK